MDKTEKARTLRLGKWKVENVCSECPAYDWQGENTSQGDLGFRCYLGAYTRFYDGAHPIPDNCPFLCFEIQDTGWSLLQELIIASTALLNTCNQEMWAHINNPSEGNRCMCKSCAKDLLRKVLSQLSHYTVYNVIAVEHITDDES